MFVTTVLLDFTEKLLSYKIRQSIVEVSSKILKQQIISVVKNYTCI